MPSFYHGAGPQVPDRPKASRGPAKSLKSPSECTTLGTGSRGIARANSPSFSKSSNSGGPSATSERPSTTRREVPAKSEGDRTKASLQQQQEVSKVKKRDEVNNVRRSSLGKVIKGIAAGSVAVRVAS